MIKNYLNSFLTFSKKEINGLWILVLFIILISLIPLVYNWLTPPEVYSYETFKKEIKAFEKSVAEQPAKRSYYYKVKDDIEEKELNPHYFKFDPNNLPAEAWHSLGLSDKQIRTIKNYETKGGHFYKKEDLKKIYSISPEDYKKLQDYIDIPARTNETRTYKQQEYKSLPVKRNVILELNSADSASLININGIGPAFASRIIKYRNRIGGFSSKEQLREVYGIDSLKYSLLENQITVNTNLVQKINVNTVTFEELRKTPYLSYKQVNAILQYRKQHGFYNSIADLKKVAILSDETLHKIEPYLEFQ